MALEDQRPKKENRSEQCSGNWSLLSRSQRALCRFQLRRSQSGKAHRTNTRRWRKARRLWMRNTIGAAAGTTTDAAGMAANAGIMATAGITATAGMTARPIVTVATVTVGAATTGAADNSNVMPLLLACGFVMSVKQPV